jgi:uncharacterized peroxidase-related enzyme
MTRIAPLRREQDDNLKTVLEVTEAVMGFVPNSMLIMARDPDLLAAFARLSAVILIRPGRIDPGLKALLMQAVSRAAGCQYCVAHSANLAASRAIPAHKIEQVWRFETSPEFSEAERAALRFAHAAGQVPNAVSDAHFADLRRHYDDEQVIEIVATLSFLGFLNRWNDTFATPLESVPRAFAQRNLSTSGWTLGKHLGATVDSPSPRSATRLRVRLFRWLFNRFAPKPPAL